MAHPKRDPKIANPYLVRQISLSLGPSGNAGRQKLGWQLNATLICRTDGPQLPCLHGLGLGRHKELHIFQDF